ncbi:hypothetical protein XpruCFBP8354_08430 [Xanthomonas prunicola]|uniref:Uncharacterized protein n=1 Tax=Xanthomonas prunicola TaxID=2053930 RepID=A0ABX4RNG2_9XANT|nr:hypothetical protein XpruCFBP8354_08430 [Xanthomonas prunicola]
MYRLLSLRTLQEQVVGRCSCHLCMVQQMHELRTLPRRRFTLSSLVTLWQRAICNAAACVHAAE